MVSISKNLPSALLWLSTPGFWYFFGPLSSMRSVCPVMELCLQEEVWKAAGQDLETGVSCRLS